MAIVDFMLQKKGGVGKSVCASLLCQALMEAGVDFIGVDTDPSNQSLAAYKELPVKWLNLLSEENDDDIDKRLFDSLVGSICSMESSGSHVVIDVGASNFPALRSYFVATHALDVLTDLGHDVRFHVTIAGGTELVATCACLMDLSSMFPTVSLVPWLNPYKGVIYDRNSKSGTEKSFMDFKVSQEFGHRYLAIVEIPDRCRNTLFGNDLQNHFAKFMTFKTAITWPGNHIMVRQRLKMFWEESFAAIEVARLL